MKHKEALRRYAVCSCGILASSAGIALLTKSGLGTSQISSLPYVASRVFTVSFGAATFAMNAFFVLVQLVMLRRNFGKGELLQIPLTFLFSVSIDCMMFLCAPLAPTFYALKIGLCLAGSFFVAFGISLQIVSAVAILPGDGIVRAISRKTNRNFGTIKTIFDLTLVALAIILSLAAFRKVVGIREGTIIAALIVGSIVRFLLARLERLHRWFSEV
jgi:uncharacterized membrane protein YczE